ncbi:hypothetical protein ABKN59_011496 [Abortiporus biennis]
MSETSNPNPPFHNKTPHIINISTILDSPPSSSSTLINKTHPFDSTRAWQTFPIGDQTGLTKLGIHLNRIPPNTIGTSLHWHEVSEEWCYILEAGKGAVLLVIDEEEEEYDDGVETVIEKKPRVKEIPISKGSFLAFPAGVKRAHGLKSDDNPIIYLVGGSRVEVDVCHYPELEKMLVYHSTASQGWLMDDKHVQVRPPKSSNSSK